MHQQLLYGCLSGLFCRYVLTNVSLSDIGLVQSNCQLYEYKATTLKVHIIIAPWGKHSSLLAPDRWQSPTEIYHKVGLLAGVVHIETSALHLVYTGSIICLLSDNMDSLNESACVRRQQSSHSVHQLRAYFYRSIFSSFAHVTTMSVSRESELCQNAGDVHSVWCLNTSCADTDAGVELPLLKWAV